MRWNHLHCRFMRTWPLDHLKGAVRKIIFIREAINNRVNKGELNFLSLFSSFANRFFCCSSAKRSSSKSKKEHFLALFLLTFITFFLLLFEGGGIVFVPVARGVFVLPLRELSFVFVVLQFHVVVQPLFVELVHGEFDLPLLFFRLKSASRVPALPHQKSLARCISSSFCLNSLFFCRSNSSFCRRICFSLSLILFHLAISFNFKFNSFFIFFK